MILQTGGGKSLLFILPAVIENDRSITLVISPLRALQDDQGRSDAETGRSCAAPEQRPDRH